MDFGSTFVFMFNRYDMHYHGQMALQISLLVAFTQLIPEHQVQLFGVIKARVKVWILFRDGQEYDDDYVSQFCRVCPWHI